MSICLATKGMICPAPLIIPQRTPFSPILDFDVELILEKPLSLSVLNLDTLGKPAMFRVEDLSPTVNAPVGFAVEGNDGLAIPAGFNVSDESFVAIPKGFALEDA